MAVAHEDIGAALRHLGVDVDLVRAWIEDVVVDMRVDTINGFVENYLDARGVKGAWEAIVFCVNRVKTESLHRLALAEGAGRRARDLYRVCE